MFVIIFSTELGTRTYFELAKLKKKRGSAKKSESAERERKLKARKYELGCAVIFASKRNEAKRKRNFFRFDAKKSDFFACFASMRNIEIWSETKMKRNGSEIIFASIQKVYENEMKRKKRKWSKNFKAKRIKLNSGTICKETKKNIKVCPSVCQVYT
jgi:hypothetical protein